MIKIQDRVREFHETFGLAIDVEDTPELREFRYELIDEEFHEAQAELIGDEYDDGTPIQPPGRLEAVAKELADLVYVAFGTAVSLGIDLEEAVRRVHMSNMSKLGPDGEVLRRSDGKVLKGPNYREPDMAGVVGRRA